MLQLEHVSVSYDDRALVLRDVSLRVEKGGVTCVLGANGAGKTTLLRTITGLIAPAQGTVQLDDRRIDRLKPHQIARLGVGVVPEGRRLFPRFTVRENLRIGAYAETRLERLEARLAEVFAIFPILRGRQTQVASTLSGGEQGMLAIARALMGRPRLLLLDEPSLGLAPLMVRELFRVVRRIHEQGVTVLLIEQNAGRATAIASHGYVLQKGAIVAEGTGAELRGSALLRRAYL